MSHQNNTGSFQIEEATISELHEAIKTGKTNCVEIVQSYINRSKAYNGVSSMLVTEDGATISDPVGVVRAGEAIRFPTRTIPVTDVLPDFEKYKGLPLEFGRMEKTASDPSVEQQFGMIAGIPDAGQVNALATLNIRGERSVTCHGDYDRHPSEGPLPEGAPPVCEVFRHFPDALERAAELDSEYGTNPDLEAMPMYGVTFSFKDPFDTKDMRSTGGGDADYDIDFPSRDHVLVDQLRQKGAIIFAKAINTEYNGRAGDPGGGKNHPEKVLPSTLGYQRSTWGGNPSNPYDTTRAASLGSSSGSAVSVSANLVMASLGEETRASCRGPSNHNSVALILPHKSMLGFDGGAIGADIYCDRSGVHCRSIIDCAKVLDALKDPEEGYYDPRDPFTTVPRSSVIDTPFSQHVHSSGSKNELHNIRLGVIRESMVYPEGSKTEEPIINAAITEINEILRGHLGATLVESSDPLWEADAEVESMKTDFRRALAKLVPVFMPDLLFRLDNGGEPVFKDFASAIIPTEFMPGIIFGEGDMKPIDYMVEMAEGRISPPSNLDIATIQHQEMAMAFRFHIPQYLSRRSDDWAELGFTETLRDFSTLNSRSKFWGDDQRASFKNWEEVSDPRNPHGSRQGVNERIMLRELLRRVDMMVILENHLDALVRLHTPWPPGIIGGPPQYGVEHNLRPETFNGPNAGLTEILIPAGYVKTVYDPVYTLSEDGTRYLSTASNLPTTIKDPGLPFSLVFRAEPGKEDILLSISSAYEAASKRRVPPPDFGQLSV
ncbi:MAG: amidase [Alphaproteobacteria bacterium]|jgi:amidase|nr:amidase [Alphaproteobacteria bacterium]PPR12495.1 MAG: Glutamyl-tRNA(Gln) amidotransferase subunit A [Alphaproteobacteria bacterium MarineAlpha12_Bin1]|tara:strand:- start:8414 stop:10741 length:2328 start_codon:yes stop_codon:yes gene_type:complete